MNVYCNFLNKALCALCVIAFSGCYIFEASDESDYAPSVKQAAGCWLSTENIVSTIVVRTGATYYVPIADFVDETPQKTCMELCIREDSSFTFIGKIVGKGVYPDISIDVYGMVDPDTIMYLGDGGIAWHSYWSRRGYVVESDGDTTLRGFQYHQKDKIRLVGGNLSGVSLWVKELRETVRFDRETERVYRRTDDKDACKNLEAE